MSDSAASEPTTAEPQGVVGEVTTLIIALAAMWMAPFVLHRLVGMQFIGMANLTAIAVASAIWTLYGPGAWPLRAAWGVALPMVLLWLGGLCGWCLGMRGPDQASVGFVVFWFGHIWLVQLMVWLCGWNLFPPLAATPARTIWQFSIADLMGTMIPLALIFAITAHVAKIPYRPGLYSGWEGGAIFAFAVLFFLPNIVPITIGACLATWSAPRGVIPTLITCVVAGAVSVLYTFIAVINNVDPIPVLLACASFFAFTWCSARLLHRVREVTMGEATPPAER